MQHCWIHDQNGGNAVKSRAERNEIYYNWIESSLYHELELIGPDPDGGVPPTSSARTRTSSATSWCATDSFSFVRIGGDGDRRERRPLPLREQHLRRAAPNGAAVFRCFDALESVEMHNNVFYRCRRRRAEACCATSRRTG